MAVSWQILIDFRTKYPRKVFCIRRAAKNFLWAWEWAILETGKRERLWFKAVCFMLRIDYLWSSRIDSYSHSKVIPQATLVSRIYFICVDSFYRHLWRWKQGIIWHTFQSLPVISMAQYLWTDTNRKPGWGLSHRAVTMKEFETEGTSRLRSQLNSPAVNSH